MRLAACAVFTGFVDACQLPQGQGRTSLICRCGGVLAFIAVVDARCCMAASCATSGITQRGELVLAVASTAYLGRYRGQTRIHTESDLRVFLRWCTAMELDPLAAVRADIERYVRWLQDVCCYQPSTVSRRLSVVVGFYRICVIDQILPQSPADYVRRPTVPVESPTLASDTYSAELGDALDEHRVDVHRAVVEMPLREPERHAQ